MGLGGFFATIIHFVYAFLVGGAAMKGAEALREEGFKGTQMKFAIIMA